MIENEKYILVPYQMYLYGTATTVQRYGAINFYLKTCMVLFILIECAYMLLKAYSILNITLVNLLLNLNVLPKRMAIIFKNIPKKDLRDSSQCFLNP